MLKPQRSVAVFFLRRFIHTEISEDGRGNMRHIYIFSSSAGETCERVVKATLAQFDVSRVHLSRKSHLRTFEEIKTAVKDVEMHPGLIVYTIVDPKLANFLHDEAEHRGLKAIDLITPIISEMQDFLNLPSKGKPGLQYKVNEAYIRGLEAVNFTVKHDDGQHVEDIHKADIVLVGVSRTSKTPLAMYLAAKGYMVANIPLVEGVNPPEKLFEINQDKIVGLTINVQRLIELRTSRLQNYKQSTRSNYNDYEKVESELVYAKRLYRQHPEWLVVDMTNKAIEEAASKIMNKFQHNEDLP
jgi:regulator of PEP synthase PpsR (kinase-PPPase family)